MLPFEPHPDGLRIYLRVTPGASRAAIAGLQPDADAKIRLKVSVTTIAEGGKANKAVIALLAKTWRLPKSSFTLISGDTHRLKTILLSGDGDVLLQNLTAWLASAGLSAST